MPELRTATAIYQNLADEYRDVLDFQLGLGTTHFYLGNVLPLTGKAAEGESELRASLAIFQRLTDGNPGFSRLRHFRGLNRFYLSALLSEAGKPEPAEAECRKALSLSQTLVDDNPTVAEFRSVLADCHCSLGILLLQTGRRANAEDECRKAQALCEKLAAEHPSLTVYDGRLALALDALGDVIRLSGRGANAKTFYDRAIALREKLLRQEPTSISYRYRLASSTWRRAMALHDLGDIAGATADTRRALEVSGGLQSRSGTQLFETACCHAALAVVAAQAGPGFSAAEGADEADRAMEWLRKAVASGFRNKSLLRTESAIDSFRNRADFKKLVAELEKNAPPQQEKR